MHLLFHNLTYIYYNALSRDNNPGTESYRPSDRQALPKDCPIETVRHGPFRLNAEAPEFSSPAFADIVSSPVTIEMSNSLDNSKSSVDEQSTNSLDIPEEPSVAEQNVTQDPVKSALETALPTSFGFEFEPIAMLNQTVRPDSGGKPRYRRV